MTIRKSTPVLYVESLAPSLAFFDALGFARTMEVPEIPDDPTSAPGFCILVQQNTEIMLQTHASAIRDADKMDPAHFTSAHSFLFMETEDLDGVERALKDHVVLMPRRTTFYGATEIGWREPGGHVVVVAQFSDGQA